jgi:hypothetical protein
MNAVLAALNNVSATNKKSGAGVQGAGPGTLLGGRYALRNRLSQSRNLERWSAHDTTLEREVALTIVDSDHPNRAGVLDAARRAAGVEDARLVRILDVGHHDGSSFIVEEAMSGSESLAAVLHQGPLPAEEARRIAGETAKGLDTAGQRGLHHLRLTPDSVLIAHDGSIRVSGVAVAAAIDGPDEDEPDPATASRRDAVCLVAVTYAALTGRWPLDERVSGVEPAPRVVDGAAAPSEIAAGVPGDLDALCHMTLNEGTGPSTPGDFASQIAPWSREQVHRDGVDPNTVSQPVSWGNGQDGVPAGPTGTEPTVAMSTHDFPTQQVSTKSPDEVRRPDDSGSEGEPAGEHSVGDKPASAGDFVATKAAGTALAGAGATAGVVGGKLSSFARAAVDRGGKAAPDLGSSTPGQMGLPQGLLGKEIDVGPPLPMLPASTALPPSRSQSKVVILIVAAFVALSLLIAYFGIRDLGGSAGTSDATSTVRVTSPPVKAPAVPAQPTATTAPAGGRPIAILSATGFDPEGDHSEKNSQAARVYDDDVSTMWTSEGYNSPQFGGLKKGAGVLLDLGQPTSTHQVSIELGFGPVDVTVYAATETSVEGATVIGEATAASGQIQLKAASVMPKAQYVIVWFTKLAPDDGQFRASIAEIALT